MCACVRVHVCVTTILKYMHRKKLTPTSFMMCVMKISDLFHGSFLKRHSALSHNLDKRQTKLEVSQTESSANNDFVSWPTCQNKTNIFTP